MQETNKDTNRAVEGTLSLSPTFSVIMPCYNSQAYVRDCIDSILSQTYPRWELIAINDGSTDETLNILNEYAGKDDRIKVYSKENGGYCSAINLGLTKITGDYFLMIGSDDRLEPTLFSVIVTKMEAALPDVIAFRAVKIRGDSQRADDVTDFDTLVYENDMSIKAFSEAYPRHSEILFVRDTAKCFKTKLLGNLRYFGKYGFDADGIFSTLFVRQCRSFLIIPFDGYLWTIRGDSVSANLSEEKNWDRLENWIHYYLGIQTLKEEELTEKEKKYIDHLSNVKDILLFRANHFSLKRIQLLLQAHRLYMDAVQRFHCEDNRPSNPLLRIIHGRFPLIWFLFFRIWSRKNPDVFK